MKITEIFVCVQKSSAAHHKYVKELEELFIQDGVDAFYDDFRKCLLSTFTNDFKLKNPFLDRYYDFCISFIDVLDTKPKKSNSEESLFVNKIFETILNCFDAISVNVRYQACLFIHKYILYLSKKDKTIKENLYEKITKVVLETLEDVNVQIRVISANILKLLQDFEGSEDPFSSVLIDNLKDNDGKNEAKVRAAIIDALIPTANNLPHIISRCRDIDEYVRITAFKKVASVPIQIFKIEERQFLLKNGLNDRSERVKKYLEATILPEWLKYFEYDYIKLLKALQLDSNKKEINDTKKVYKLVLESLFSSRPIQDILEALFLEEKLLPLEQLTWESAFYWKFLINHLRTKNLEQYWELILPETVLFCDYLDKFCSSSALLTGSIWEQQLYMLIFHELLSIAFGCDITDEASRRRLYSLLVTILKEKNVSEEITTDTVQYFKVLIPNTEQRVNFFCEMISDIRTPLVSSVSSEHLNELDEKKRELAKKLSQLLKEKTRVIEEQDFEKAKVIKLEISNTKESLQNIDNELTLPNEEEPNEKSNDPAIVTKCLDILLALLKFAKTIPINSALKSIKDEIFMEIMTCRNSVILGKYFRSYGAICSLEKTAAEENIQFFCLPLTLYAKDKSGDIEVITAIIDVIGDLILLYGTKIISTFDAQNESKSSLDFNILYGNNETTLNEVVDILSLLLDDENEEIRLNSCEVLTKIMLHGRIESPELFSRLFIKWQDPATAKDVQLRQVIGVFIELFIQQPNIELQLEEAVIPILRTISLAPLTSSLANVSEVEIIKIIIKMINLRHDLDYSIHENLAMRICAEILKDLNCECVPLFARMLLYLEIYRDDKKYIETLLNLCEDILIDAQDRSTLSYMRKFIFSLKHD